MITCQSAIMDSSYNHDSLLRRCSQLSDSIHSFDRKQCILNQTYGSDNVVYGHAHVKVLQYHINDNNVHCLY